jgi:LCP family protein required for cell wall assembly
VTKAAGKDPHRRTVLGVILVTQLVLALLTGTTVALSYQHVNKHIQTGAPITGQGREKHLVGGDPLNILVMGTDSRSGSGDDIDSQAGCDCSDTTILLHISADRKTVYGVSLPRDAMVKRPDCKVGSKVFPGSSLDMFNAAFSVGGPTCTVEQVHALTGIYIDHYVVVDFAGFKKMVDAIHGVQVCIPEDVNDQAHGIVLKKGTQTLNGDDALKYVRERYDLSPNADIGRMKRQQAFIASMLNKVISAGTLSHPDRVYHFADAAAGSVTTDPALASLGNLVKLARQVRRTNLDDISFITVPFEAYPPDPNRLQWAPTAKQLWARMRADKPLGKAFLSQVITAQDLPGSSSANPSGSASGTPSHSPSSTTSTSPSTSSSANAADKANAADNGLCA